MTTTQTETETITTSFPLGLFCNATLSGPIPKAKPAKASEVSRKTERKSEHKMETIAPAAPIDSQSKGWMKSSTWTIARPRNKA